MNFKGWFVKSGSEVNSVKALRDVVAQRRLFFQESATDGGERIRAGKVNKVEKELFLKCGRKEWG